jgi:hypothetical protein
MQQDVQQGEEEEEGHQLELPAAMSQVVPTFSEDTPRTLRLPLPDHVATHYSSVLLELGGVCLPAWVTQELTLKPDGQHGSVVTNSCSWTPFTTAQLLPCTAVQVGEEWAVVVRATWPPAQPGHLVSIPSHMVCCNF